MCGEYDSHPDYVWYSGACALKALQKVMIVVSVLLSAINCSTWREDSSGYRSNEVREN